SPHHLQPDGQPAARGQARGGLGQPRPGARRSPRPRGHGRALRDPRYLHGRRRGHARPRAGVADAGGGGPAPRGTGAPGRPPEPGAGVADAGGGGRAPRGSGSRGRPLMRGALLAIVLLLASGTGAGAEGVMVTLGTATPGGGFPVYGDALAQVINEVDPALEVRTRNTKGSTENVPLLEAGQLDLALVQGEVAPEALPGVGGAPGQPRVFPPMRTTPGH